MSTLITGEEIAGQLGKAYILHARCHTANASSGAFMALTNLSQKYKIALTRLYFDAHSLSQDLIITQIKNPTLSGDGSDASITDIIDKGMTNEETFDATLKISDASADLTYAGGIEYHAFKIGSKESVLRDMKGTNVIHNGNTVLWGWETFSGNAVDGEVVSLSMNLYIL